MFRLAVENAGKAGSTKALPARNGYVNPRVRERLRHRAACGNGHRLSSARKAHVKAAIDRRVDGGSRKELVMHSTLWPPARTRRIKHRVHEALRPADIEMRVRGCALQQRIETKALVLILVIEVIVNA